MGQYQRGLDDVTDLAWTRGDVRQRSPASGELREAAFTQAPQTTQQGVVGTVVDVEHVAAWGLLFHAGGLLATAVGGEDLAVQGSSSVTATPHIPRRC